MANILDALGGKLSFEVIDVRFRTVAGSEPHTLGILIDSYTIKIIDGGIYECFTNGKIVKLSK